MQILTIALALGVIYFLFSSLVSVLSEMRTDIVRSREEMLKGSIYEAFNDESKNTAFGNLVYYHPLLDLYRRTATDMVEHIPAENLAKAVIAVLQRYATLIVYPVSRKEGDAEYNENNLIPVNTVEEYHKLIIMLQPSDKRNLFESFAINTTSMEQVGKNIANWFDGYMIQNTKWFKKSKRRPLFVISLLAAITLNVNSIAVINYLRTHTTAAGTIADQAPAILVKGRPNTSASTRKNKDSIANSDSLKRQYVALDSQINSLNLPIGWKNETHLHWKLKGPDNIFNSINTSILKSAGEDPTNNSLQMLLLGWLITAYLGSVGAPFWFDFINRFVNLRRSGNTTQQKGGKK